MKRYSLYILLLALLATGVATHKVYGNPGDLAYWGPPGAANTVRINPFGSLLISSNQLWCYNTINHFTGTLTAAQIAGMYTTAVDLLPGPGAGSCWVLNGPVHIRNIYGTAAIASGGAVVIQYHSGAVAATSTMAGAKVTISSASNENVLIPVAAAPAVSTGVTATDAGALEITNGTGLFTQSGSTSTMVIDFNYRSN